MKELYEIQIKPPLWDGYKYSLYYGKNYGDHLGGAREFKTKEELIEFVKKVFKEWERFDSIANRMGDKVMMSNLKFSSFTSDITKGELFGNKNLNSFLRG